MAVTDPPVPVGGRRVHTTSYHQDIHASDVKIITDDHTAFVHLASSVLLIPFGYNREQQLLMLATIGDTIREQAKDALAALRAAEDKDDPTLWEGFPLTKDGQ